MLVIFGKKRALRSGNDLAAELLFDVGNDIFLKCAQDHIGTGFNDDFRIDLTVAAGGADREIRPDVMVIIAICHNYAVVVIAACDGDHFVGKPQIRRHAAGIAERHDRFNLGGNLNLPAETVNNDPRFRLGGRFFRGLGSSFSGCGRCGLVSGAAGAKRKKDPQYEEQRSKFFHSPSTFSRAGRYESEAMSRALRKKSYAGSHFSFLML